jgi:hypothetical protein
VIGFRLSIPCEAEKRLQLQKRRRLVHRLTVLSVWPAVALRYGLLLEYVFQRELQDPWVSGSPNVSERSAVSGRDWSN